MGMSKDAANKLWAEVSKGVTPINAVRTGLAQSATASDNLDNSGFFAGIKGRYVAGFNQVATWFGTTLPHAMANVGTALAGAWDTGARAFDTQKKDVDNFFTGDIPNWAKNIGTSLAGDWKSFSTQFMNDYGTPVSNWFTQSLPHAFSLIGSSLSGDWKSFSTQFMNDYGTPLTNWFTQSLPHAFGNIGSALSTAWGTSYNGFQRDFAGPITNYFTNTLPKSEAGIAVSAVWSTTYQNFQRNLAGPLTSFFTTTFPGWLSSIGRAWTNTNRTMGNDFVTYVWNPFTGFFTKTVPGWFSGMGSGWSSTNKGMGSSFVTYVWNPFTTFFTSTIPGWLRSFASEWLSNAQANWNSFYDNVVKPFTTFFNNTIVSWLKGFASEWLANAQANWNSFYNSVIKPMTTFFNNTIVSWLRSFASEWLANAQANWNSFYNNVVKPFTTFFDSTIPGWLSGFGRQWLANAQTLWNDFYGNVIKPMSGFFTSTLPNLISSAVKGGVNTAIGYLNDAIKIINAVTGIVGITAIKPISPVAASGGVMPKRYASGSIAGTGDEDGTHIVAMGGEYMVRKPARMALEAKYGRNFMNTLNQADQWLGAGSRGNAASQRPPHRAAGGAAGMAAGGMPADLGTGIGPSEAQMVSWFGPIGDPGHEAMINFAGQQMQVNKLVAGTAQTIGNEVNAAYPSYVDRQSGGFRTSIGASTSNIPYSMHQLGLAIDINPDTNPYLGSTGDILQHPKVIQSFKNHGWFWGGNWGPGSRDQMHFQLENTQGQVAGGGSGGGGILGVLSQIWQNVEGLLNAAGDAVTGNVAPLAKWVKGGASALLGLAKQGAKAIFDGVWAGGVAPILDKAQAGGISIPVSLLEFVAADIKSSVDSLLSAKDSAAQSSVNNAAAATGVGAGTPGHGLVPANAAPIAAYLESQGLNKNAVAGILGNIEQESGGNPDAGSNPPGKGLIQILGDPGGSLAQDLPRVMAYIAANGSVADINAQSSTPTSAAVYFSQKYERPGNPQIQNRIAAAVASAAAGYASGGVAGDCAAGTCGHNHAASGGVGDSVVSAIEATTQDESIREAMAFGSWLETRWDPSQVDATGKRLGPFQLTLGPGQTAAEAQNPAWSAARMLPSYTQAVRQTASLRQRDPRQAAEQAAFLAEHPQKSYWLSQGPAAMTKGWGSVMQSLGRQLPDPVSKYSAKPLPHPSAHPAAAAVHGTTGTLPVTGATVPAGGTVAATVKVPSCAGGTTGSAHNAIVAAGLVPTGC